MANTTTLNESLRSPVLPSDYVRLATPGANWKTQLSGMCRVILTQASTYYVASSGSDVTGDGSSGNPWATLSKANHFLQTNIDFGGQRVDLILQSSGTYVTSQDANNNVDWGGYIGGGTLSIHALTTLSTNFIVTDAPAAFQAIFTFTRQSATNVRISQLTMQPVSNSAGAVNVNAAINVIVGPSLGDGIASAYNLDLSSTAVGSNSWTGYGVQGGCGGILTVTGQQAITSPSSGNTISRFFYLDGLGQAVNAGGNLTLGGTHTFSTGITVGPFASCRNGWFSAGGENYVFTAGSATGQRFVVDNGIIDTFGKGLNWFPGNSPGTMIKNGVYHS